MLCKKKNPKREKNHQVLFLLFIFKISFRPFCARFLGSTCSNLPIDIKRALSTFQGRISETTIAMQLSPISFRAQLNRYELLCAEKIENIDKVQRVVRELFWSSCAGPPSYPRLLTVLSLVMKVKQHSNAANYSTTYNFVQLRTKLINFDINARNSAFALKRNVNC